ncbi:MAG: glycoside hydrolase family 16 protein [Propionibacteriaceae bacterium]|nr:glycoside hydrolase family 16 protein [Propionibacteriaceae bacterium]
MQSLLDDSLAEIQRYRTYGGWSVQRPEYGTLGRFDPAMTWLLPDGRTFALTLRLDRAAYQLYREAEVPHDQALHNSLLCGSWAGLHNAPGLGTWEMELRAPASDRVELVAMLWPEDDQEWPLGEINFVEGRVGTGSTMTNLHWPDPATGQPAHDPEDIAIDVTQWHRYRIEITTTGVRWLVDGRLRRELVADHAPHDVPMHFVVQCGVNPAIHEDWHDDLEWEQTILFRPLTAPGVPLYDEG